MFHPASLEVPLALAQKLGGLLKDAQHHFRADLLLPHSPRLGDELRLLPAMVLGLGNKDSQDVELVVGRCCHVSQLRLPQLRQRRSDNAVTSIGMQPVTLRCAEPGGSQIGRYGAFLAPFGSAATSCTSSGAMPSRLTQ